MSSNLNQSQARQQQLPTQPKSAHLTSSLSPEQVKDLHKRYINVYIAVITLGIIFRQCYLYSHDLTPPKRTDVSTFTRIKLIDSWMLLWPFIGIVVNWLVLYFSTTKPNVVDINLRQHFECKVVFKWVLSYVMFRIFYSLMHNYGGGFDPSGHLNCAMITYANWLNLCIFLKQYQIYQRSKHFETVKLLTTAVGMGLMFYQLYSLMFTVVIYHDAVETIHGFLFGYVLVWLCVQNDYFSDAVYTLYIPIHIFITQGQRLVIREQIMKKVVPAMAP
eukprot:403332015